MLKVLGIVLSLLVWSGVALARGSSVHVSGYTRSTGTYVAPHYRTAPNRTRLDNWSVKPNVNPYTGRAGTKSPD